MPDLHIGDRVTVHVSPERKGWTPNDANNGRVGTVAEYIGKVGSLPHWGVRLDGYTLVGIYAEDELRKAEEVSRGH